MSNKFSLSNTKDDLVKAFFKDVHKYKILDNETLNKLIDQAHAGNQKARDKAILANVRYVVSVAKKFQNRGIALPDLIASGLVGLITAIDKFDTTMNVPFLGYAKWWIRQSLFQIVYNNGSEIRIPSNQRFLMNKITDATNTFIKKNGRNPTTNELHEITNIPASQIDYLSQFYNKTASLDETVGNDEETSQLCELIPDGEPLLDEQISKDITLNKVLECLSKLNNKEHDIICLYFGLGVPKTSRVVIGQMLGMCAERIRQIKNSGITKIHKRCAAYA